MKRILSLLLLFTFLFSSVSPARADDSLRVHYSGAEGAVKQALELANFILVDDPAQADVFVLNGVAPNVDVTGKGLVLILGEQVTPRQAQSLTGIPLEFQRRDEPVSLTSIDINDPLTTEIIWNGAPQIRERYEIVTPMSSVQPLVVGYEDDAWVVWNANNGKTFIVNAFLSGEANPQIQEWAYFNYWIYHMVMRAGGRTPLSFAEYPASPVPHAAERNLLIGLMAVLVAGSFTAFYFVRRWSKSHPEALDRIVSDRNRFEIREEQTEWEQVGFHRPLSGFLVALATGVILFIPLIIYQNLILPTYILPSAQALGTWGRVTQFFNLTWTFFDMGTSIAFIKYLAQYRVNDPKRGIQFGQVFIWWQLLSGAVQVALVIALAATVAPGSAYALYAWSVIIHAFIQIPGFYQVMRHALTGLQRNDYARYLDIGLNVLLPMLVQPIFVGIMYAWGKAHPAFGGALGGLFGLGLAAYAAEFFTFIIGLWMYRRIGYNASVLFMAHFDWDVVKASFRFGAFEMLGSLAWAGGQAAEIAITQARLINYAEIWGNWGLAQNFVFAFNVVSTLGDAVMPSISEAISHGRKILSQYYSVMFYKWGGMISAFLAAVLLAVAPRFILGASGAEFERASVYAVPLIFWGAVQYLSWVGDQVQLGANKPQYKSVMVTLEQIIRVTLALILLARFQVTALIVAYFVGLLVKGIGSYFVDHKFCFPQRFFLWQSATAPLLAAGAHFLLLNWISGLIWQGDQITSILIFFIGILPSLPLFMFFYGLVGGWDSATLDEFRDAASLTGFIRPAVDWLMYYPSAFGARLSPLHNRFAITIRAAAMEEAKSLTAERVKL